MRPDADTVFWLRLVFGLALLVRLAAGIVSGRLWDPELHEYYAIARNMLRGDGFTHAHLDVVYHSYAPPLYPWLSAAAYWLSGSMMPLMLLQAVAGAALAAVTAAIAWRLFGNWTAGVVAAGLVAVHPGLALYSAAKAHPLTFDALFFALALLQSFRWVERPTMRRAIEFGLIVGVGTLSRATMVIFLPVVSAWLVLRTAQPWNRVISQSLIAGLCAATLIAPWTIRTSLLHQRFVFLVTTDAENFWLGNNPSATGHSYIDANRIVLDAPGPQEVRDLRQQPNELAQRAWFATRARAFVRDNPGTFLRVTAQKFFYFWWFAPQTGVLYPPAWFYLYLAYYVTVVGLAVVGVWTLVRTGGSGLRLASLLGVFLLALSLLQSLYYVEGRHRWGVEPIVLALSGGGFAALAERRRSTR